MAQGIRTFRIFVSSTFNDLREERNALQKHVFPRLKQLCLTRGTRFQPIDLRWGVPDEAALDHRTMRICLDEIARCRRASPRPNFIILLGDRYGWRPLPAAIPASEFERLRAEIAAGADGDLVDAWYRRDDNAVPPEFRLEPRGAAAGDERSAEAREAARRDEAARWAGIEASLGDILSAAAARAGITGPAREKYEASATEQEIRLGALEVSDAVSHVFCFFRSITNPETLAQDLSIEMPAEIRAANFVDTGADGRVDAGARARQDALEQALVDRLPDNVTRYESRWLGRAGAFRATSDTAARAVMDAIEGGLREALTGGRGVEEVALWGGLAAIARRAAGEAARAAGSSETGAADSPISLDHLPGLCADVYLALARVILTEIARLEDRDALETEIDDHKAFGRDRRHGFVGRARVLAAIAEYLGAAIPRPLVVHGPSGSGKSAVMARAAAAGAERLGERAVIERFIGATPGSSDIRTLLDGLCREISRLSGADESGIPADYRELVQELPRRLALATADRPLAIFLDALDQLSDADRAREAAWLPASLPDHVRLVVSALPGDALAALERRLPGDALVAIEPMPADEAGALLDAWLAAAGRTLQPDQRRQVLEAFAANGLPLYLKLAFEDARRWSSRDRAARLGADLEAMVRDLYARLSLPGNHGTVMVARSLAYLAASRHGLSEDELLDVLTIDRDVFEDFTRRRRHEPPEPRLPVVVWSRLFFDLEPYLTERAADGASLLGFYHRQLREVAEREYLAPEVKTARHRTLAEYFASRPLFEAAGGAANVRKLSELPFQQTHAEQWDALYATLTDFDFLEAKCTHVGVVTQGRGADARTVYGGVYELQEDYRRALERFPAE